MVFKQYEELHILKNEISKFKIDTLPRNLLLEAKQKGYGDRQIAHILKCLESEVYSKRQEMNVNRVYKLVDTCAAEFKAFTLIITPLLKMKLNQKMALDFQRMKATFRKRKK